MTSEKKAQANRRNALKSTGPKTPEGKAAVRLNALRHGLRSEEILLRGEDEEALRELDEYLRAELQPVGELENLLIGRRRILEASAIGSGGGGRIHAAILRRCGDSDASKLDLSFIRDGNGANTFSKLSRYEAGIVRGLYKALHELQRLQAACCADGNAPPPVATDMDVSGVSGEER